MRYITCSKIYTAVSSVYLFWTAEDIRRNLQQEAWYIPKDFTVFAKMYIKVLHSEVLKSELLSL